MPIESPQDWVIDVRYIDQKNRDRQRTIHVAPLYRQDEYWHRTTEDVAIDAALRHCIWGVGEIRCYGIKRKVVVRLNEHPEAVISATPRRRHDGAANTVQVSLATTVAGRFL